ncbi:NACHT, LRR and PYD domains-containing protein 1-like isoform X2 [Amphiprion ocellaris]|uniref:NACHT, LRR and PYD domains-containing protein 1-like isoform X2 n=1 Tax=Amphiprion ocellaris TaxID=80972 RepID=UPI002410D860|nr:NACHT, LRR and PYD domains-containing protein 1-like isoform X2 [Amphiprion ocellaris]
MESLCVDESEEAAMPVETSCSDGKESGYSEIQSSQSELPDADLLTDQASVLASNPSSLKEVDLTRHSLKEWEVEQLCAGLESPLCRLETLRLSHCILSERFYAALVSALELNPSYLGELDLSGNKSLMDSGMKLLSTGLGSPHCRLRTLRLVCCELTESSCASLLSALELNPSHLKVLDLSGNCLRDAGVRLLCAGLKNPLCRLKTLGLGSCSLSEDSCDSLALTLKSKPSRLEELDLSLNQLRDSGIKFLSALLKRPRCRLKTLRLACCLCSDKGCAALVSSLKSSISKLTELDLSGNNLKRKGMKLLTEFVKSSSCKLETLRVDYGRNLISSAIIEADEERGAHCNERGITARKLREWRKWLPRSSRPSHSIYSRQSELHSKWSGLSKSVGSVHHSAVGNKQSIDLPISSLMALPSLPELDVELHQLSALKQHAALHAWDWGLTLHPHITTTQTDWFKDEAKEMKTPSRFTPDLVKEDGVTLYRFKGLYPGVFQCDLTGLVLTMTRQGEVLYRIIQWDEGLLLSAKKVPAGPLFNIQGSEDAVSQLHLPHCEKQPSARNELLHVAHIDDDGMSILQPVEITDTHVVVSVPHFSAFGLVWDVLISLLNIQKPISGQVLLFHRLYTRQTQKLNVFLLPENVPLQEVKKQQENAEYIEAPSSCHLVPGQTYSLHCSEAHKIQPECASFELKYGPNYHPTFEIRLTLSTEEATVTVRDHEGRHAWKYHVELTGLTPALTSPALSTPSPVGDPAWLPFPTKESGSTSCSASGSVPLSTQPPASEAASLSVPAGDERPDSSRQNLQRTQCFPGKEEEKLFSVRTEFVSRVSTSVIRDLLDKLLQERVVNSGEMESLQEMARAEKARELIDMVLKKGQPACKILIDAFCELDPFLSELLQLK